MHLNLWTICLTGSYWQEPFFAPQHKDIISINMCWGWCRFNFIVGRRHQSKLCCFGDSRIVSADMANWPTANWHQSWDRGYSRAHGPGDEWSVRTVMSLSSANELCDRCIGTKLIGTRGSDYRCLWHRAKQMARLHFHDDISIIDQFPMWHCSFLLLRNCGFAVQANI